VLTALLIILAVIAIAALVKFYPDLRKRSLTVGIRSPLTYSFDLKELLQHIRESDYRWEERQEEGRALIVGTLDRGFGEQYVIAWETASGTLILRNVCDVRFFVYHKAQVSEMTIGHLPEDLRAEVSEEITHQLKMYRAASQTPAKRCCQDGSQHTDQLPRARARK
jgi:hypothetical protein